ncbi:MAG: tetratricopeptide repeat protein [Nitrospirota bacterium]
MKKIFIIIFLLPLISAFSPISTPNEKGMSAYGAGRYDDAEKDFGKAAKDNPDKPQAHLNLGDALYKKGKFDKAAQEYGEAARLKPDMPQAWYNMGDALYRMGKYNKALTAYQKADSLGKEADTEHNIQVTLERIKKDKEKKNGLQTKRGGQGQQGNREKGGQGDNPKGGSSGKTGNTARNNQPGQGGQSQGLSEGDIDRMLAGQRAEEKSLRNSFRPGKKEDPLSQREAQIEQILRSIGAPMPAARPPKPGAPYIEKDW